MVELKPIYLSKKEMRKNERINKAFETNTTVLGMLETIKKLELQVDDLTKSNKELTKKIEDLENKGSGTYADIFNQYLNGASDTKGGDK